MKRPTVSGRTGKRVYTVNWTEKSQVKIGNKFQDIKTEHNSKPFISLRDAWEFSRNKSLDKDKIKVNIRFFSRFGESKRLANIKRKNKKTVISTPINKKK